MQKSESLKNIAAALITFHAKMETVKKDSTNPFFKSKYASLSNILEAIKTPLEESGLTFSQLPMGENSLSTIIIHAGSGEYLCADYNMKPAKDDPQGRGSAITYQRRYALASILGLNIDEDDDGNQASKPGAEKAKSTPAANGQATNGDDKPWLNETSPEFKGAVEKIKAGKSSLTALRNYFKISKAVETKINELTLQPA